MRKAIIAAIAVCMFSQPAWSQRAAALRGAANVSCGEFAQSRGTAGEHQYTQWIVGYLSGYNNFSAYPEVAIPDGPTVLLYGDKFCREHPLLYVRDIAVSLISDLGGYKAPRTAK